MSRLILCGFVASVVLFNAVESDAAETLHVALDRNRVERFTLTGAPLGGFNVVRPFNIAVDSTGATYVASMGLSDVIRKFDSFGQLEQFIEVPFADNALNAGIAVDDQDRVYYGLNGPQDKILRFAPDGQFLDIFVSLGLNNAPFDMEFDAAGNMALTHGAVNRYDASGARLNSINVSSKTTSYLFDVAVDSTGNIYALTFDQIVKYTPTGDFSTLITPPERGSLLSIAVDASDILFVGGHLGSPSAGFVDRYASNGDRLGRLLSGLPGAVADLEITGALANPEPTSLTMLGLAMVSVVHLRRRGGR